MTARLSDNFTEDEITGAIVAVIIIGALIAAFVLLWHRGWPGGARPLIDSVRPEASRRAIEIMRWAFAATGLIVGTRRISDVPLTGRVYGLVFAVAVLICCTTNWEEWHVSADPNFWELMDLRQTIRFVAPTVAAYLIGTCLRIWSRRSR